jgi:Ca2+-binding RTX toxin-like protein
MAPATKSLVMGPWEVPQRVLLTILPAVAERMLYDQAGDDKVDSGSGDDEVHAGNGNDKAIGNIGNDVCLDGDDDTDTIDGGPGNDCINGEGNNPGPRGADILLGSTGNDDISAYKHHSTEFDGKKDKIDCGPGFDSAWFNTSTDHDMVASNCEDMHTS